MKAASDLFDLTGRVALVTGSSAGLGLAMARGLAGAGARVVLNGRRSQKVNDAAKSLRELGYHVAEAAFDVIDSAAVGSAIDHIENEIGPIEILINNAGMQRRAPLEDYPEEA
jgi:gluconate 5-dehydrogenase